MIKKFIFLVSIMVIFTIGTIVYASDAQYTTNLCTDPTKASASNTNSTYSTCTPDKAFDNSSDSADYPSSSWWSASLPSKLKYDFGAGNEKKIKRYSIKAHNRDTFYCPKSWTFEGSNDGVNWTTLSTVSNEPAWTALERRYYTIDNNSSYRYYSLNFTASQGGSFVIVNEIEMMEELATSLPAPINLSATSSNAKVDLSWNAVDGATYYNIKSATTSGGVYTTIATSSAITYTAIGLTNGNAYYYVVSAVNANCESANSNEVFATPKNPDVTLEVTSIDKAKVGDEITANVVICNASNICAEDIKLAFDTTRLEFISAVGADGIKIYKEEDLTGGIRRYITASLGKENAASGDKILLKLTFKAKAIGEAKVDITKGRIADNSTLEMDVVDSNCGEKTIIIESIGDVNRSGEYTLLDLGIDAWYYGDAASATDTSKYDADQDGNSVIDDGDLNKVVTEMLKNTNYSAQV